jgi:hypothetical protein
VPYITPKSGDFVPRCKVKKKSKYRAEHLLTCIRDMDIVDSPAKIEMAEKNVSFIPIPILNTTSTTRHRKYIHQIAPTRSQQDTDTAKSLIDRKP